MGARVAPFATPALSLASLREETVPPDVASGLALEGLESAAEAGLDAEAGLMGDVGTTSDDDATDAEEAETGRE